MRGGRGIAIAVLAGSACGGGGRSDDGLFGGEQSASGPSGGPTGSATDEGDDGGSGESATDGTKFDMPSGDTEGPGGTPGGDPKTCEEAEQFKTYIGCDFWPTVTANAVWPVFDYAVVVANAGDVEAEVTVERGGAAVGGVTVIPPNELRTIYLPWIDALKGPPANACGEVLEPMTATVRVADGAYHLTSSRPVTVYQFNALEYAPEGGPPGKDWSSCPAPQCATAMIDCFSYSNDASLLLPATALTTNYRVTGYPGWQAANVAGTLTITGTVDGTAVTVSLATQGAVAAGADIAAAGGGGKVMFSIDRGEVVELVGTPSTDFSGSLVQSDQPVQVIFGLPCTQVPYGTTACDHVEESVFPAETLGQRYFVTVPTSPNGQPVAHLVRIYGNVDGTQLTYPSGKPPGFPDTIDAGEVFEAGKAELVVMPFANPP
jgi:hypothetical protein